MGRLDGKVAVVLGAAAKDNMGQAIARRFASEGARVVVGGRHGDVLEAFAREIDGRHAICDITKKAEVEALAKVATDAYGRVDIAVNCTGWGLMAKLLETTEEQIDRVKEAFGAAVLQGLKGMGQFAQTAGKSVVNAARTGGAGAAAQAAGNAGRAGMARAGNFISQNPGAGAALVAAPAMAAGYAAGRQ